MSLIRRWYSTKLVKNALTFHNRQKLNATESSIDNEAVSLNQNLSEFHISMYPYYVRDAAFRQCKELTPAIKRFDDMCYYTGPERELSPSFVLLNFYQALELPHKLTLQNLKVASALAWCFEMIATGFVLEDDIMDNTKLRWKKACYHTQKSVGLSALTDTKSLYMSAFKVLQKHCSKNPFYNHLMNLLCKTTNVTSLGQSVDMNTHLEFKKTRDLNIFSYTKYEHIVKYKTSFILYKAPCLAAMYLAQIDDDRLFRNLLKICDKFAFYRQVQDDVWDVYGDFNYVGKLGSDISNGKCTWLIITAMKYATERQLKLLQTHYGYENLNSQDTVLEIYKEVDVLSKFREYKSNLLEELNEDILQLSFNPLRELFCEHVKHYININEHFLDYYTRRKRSTLDQK